MPERERTPNHRLAGVMREAGMSNKGLAKRMYDRSRSDGGVPVSPTHTNVDKWLSGRIAQPKARNCHVMLAVLGRELGRPLTLEDIGYGDVPPEGADTTLEYPETIAASITSLTQLTSYELGHSKPAARLYVVPEAWSSLLVKAMFGSEAEEKGPAEPRTVTEADVGELHEAAQMFATFDYRHGGGRPKPLVAKYLETAVLPTIPHVSPHNPVGREYFRAAAVLTRLAGWTAYDTGQHEYAQRYLYQAFRLAHAADDKALCGRILAGMSHQANFLGHYDHAVHLARAAAHGARGYATPTGMALFHAMEARALASQGNERETTGALSAAERWFEQREPANDPDWLQYFDQSELHAEFAHSYRELAKPELASHHATASITEARSMYVRSVSFVRTVLATAHLQAGELEQAIETAKGVVDTAAHLKSHRTLAYLDDFQTRLASAADGALITSFTDYAHHKLGLERPPLTGRLVVA